MMRLLLLVVMVSVPRSHQADGPMNNWQMNGPTPVTTTQANNNPTITGIDQAEIDSIFKGPPNNGQMNGPIPATTTQANNIPTINGIAQAEIGPPNNWQMNGPSPATTTQANNIPTINGIDSIVFGEIFNATGGSPNNNSTIAPTLSPTGGYLTTTTVTYSDTCQCVTYSLCNQQREGVDVYNPSKTGYTIINMRFSEDYCEDSMDVCCKIPILPTTTTTPKPLAKKPKGCGYRNSNGIEVFHTNTAQLSDWDSDTEDENNSFQSNRIKYRVNYIEELSDFDFIYRFRLNKSAVTNLLSEIYPYLKVTSSRNNGISPLHQVLLTLRYYALGTMLVSVADYVGVSISSACRIVESVSSAIAKLYNKYIKIEDHTQDQFYAIAGFPRVHGAIDCTHILIQSPGSTNAEEFRNRKGTFSLNVQGVCNAQLLFLNVVARWPGSSHDSTIFNNSVLRSQCENGALGNRWLLGDSAYPCSSYLLTPLLNPISRSEQLYNEAHIKTRNTIERCFGVWKRRFPVLSLKIRLSLAKTQPVIIATAVLHNICRKYNIQDVEPEVEVPRYQSLPTEQLSVQGLNNERLQLINNYFARFQH